MPVIQAPGFWSYLGQGLERGVEAQKIAEEEARKQAQMQYQQTLAMFSAGQANAADVNAAGARLKMPFPQVQANEAEHRRNLTSRQPTMTAPMPIPGMGGTMPGMMVRPGGVEGGSTSELIQAGIDPEKMRQTTLRNKASSGGTLSDTEYDIAGLTNPQDRTIARAGQISPLILQQATNAAGAAITNIGGRITSQNMKSIGEQAFQSWRSNSSRLMGAITPEVESQMREAIASNILDRLLQQKQLEVQQLNASGRLASADDPTKAFDVLTRALTEKNNELRVVLTASKIPEQYHAAIANGENPGSAVSSAFSQTIAQVAAIRAEMQNIGAARLETARGFMSPAATAALRGGGDKQGTPEASDHLTVMQSVIDRGGSIEQAKTSARWKMLTKVEQNALESYARAKRTPPARNN